MSDAQKVKLLGELCFDLTIDFRSIAGEEIVTPTALKRLQGINEIQHTALSQMLKHQGCDTKRYEDRDFFLILLKMSRGYELAGWVQRSLLKGLGKAVE